MSEELKMTKEDTLEKSENPENPENPIDVSGLEPAAQADEHQSEPAAVSAKAQDEPDIQMQSEPQSQPAQPEASNSSGSSDNSRSADQSVGSANSRSAGQSGGTDSSRGAAQSGGVFSRFGAKETPEARDRWILANIGKEHLMDYLKLEQRRMELLQSARDTRQKRILTAFQLTVSLAAIVAVVYLLKDNPTILVNILYIAGIIAGLWIFKNPHNKDRDK